jgi:hypothetical protein
LQKKAKSILDELDFMLAKKDQTVLLESRSLHVMQSAINLLNYISENYDADTALELERRLLNGIRNRDTAKFSRALKKRRENENK